MYALPKTTGLFHVSPFRFCQCFPLGGPSCSSVSTFFHPCCCSCCSCGRPSFITFRLLLLLPFADLFRLYLTSPVPVDNSFGVFTDLLFRVSHSIGFFRRFGFGFSYFLPVLVSFPDSVQEPTWFSVVLLLGRTDGGCQSVRDPRVA